MDAYLRTFGWPLGSLFLALTAAWIVGMIVLPQISMIERAFVSIDSDDDLTALRTEVNRATRDIAVIELDLRILGDQRDAVAGAALPGAAIAPPSSAGPLPPTVGVPTITGPAIPSVTVPRPPTVGVPTITGPGMAQPAPANTAEDVAARIATLEERKAAAEARLVDLRTEEARLRAETVDGPRYDFGNFASMSDIHLKIFVSTLGYATLVTVLAFLICYPVAYAVATSRSSQRVALLLLALVIPYTINELLRIFAWVMILEREGVLNSVLTFLGVFAEGEGPRWVASNWAVFTVMIYAYILFMVFPLYNTLETLDRNQIEAARDLGASTIMLHRRVVIPHAKPGIAVGAIMVFMLSAGSIAAPEIVGRGLHPDWFSQVIYRRFFESSNWNQGAAYSLMLLVACILFIAAVMSLFRVSIREIAR